MSDVQRLVRSGAERVDGVLEQGIERLSAAAGGSARLRVIIVLASVLGLDSADQGAIGAVAPALERSLRISNVELGLLVTVTSLVGAIATIPLGSRVDHTNRVRLLMAAVITWAIAEAASAASVDYAMLLATRVALGAVTAAAAPAVASLTGDLFPAAERGRIYGVIITGELLGAGFGVLVSGLVAGWFGWRPALAILALPSFLVAAALWRYLPEPARGGKSWIVEGAEHIPGTPEHPEGSTASTAAPKPAAGEAPASIAEVVRAEGVKPEEEIVVDGGAHNWGLREAVRYVLRVRTNVVMIVASSLGYFFFAGLKTFAVLFVRGHFGISQGLTIMLVLIVGGGAALGVIFGGRLTDKMIARHHLTARVDLGIVGYAVAALLLAPAMVTTFLPFAAPLMVIAAAGIAAPNATLDAARLDVVPAQLWGRAEAVRTVMRTVLEAFAPLIFGALSELFGSSSGGFGVVGGGLHSAPGSAPELNGLADAFLLMLIPLAASGIMLIAARRSYPTDVASAAASQRRIDAAMRPKRPANA
ncbi:MAG: MFS transporter [Actinomycetota bacterium]|nr:MFS transporter [Actinomycetota bacterium]